MVVFIEVAWCLAKPLCDTHACNVGRQVTCIYLFHELPPEVRRAAAAEMARVLRPGGLLVLTDSVQLGDRARIDANLVMFETFNEPYYRSYISEDFGAARSPCAPWNVVRPSMSTRLRAQGLDLVLSRY